MDRLVTKGVFRGRPFGGVTTTLIADKWVNSIVFSKCSGRFVVLLLHNTIFVNVYLPSVSNEEDAIAFSLIVSDINEAIEAATKLVISSVYKIVVGGDFNLNIDKECRAMKILKPFLKKWS